MLWVAAAAVALAVLARFLVRRERVQVWWIAFTMGLLGTTLGTLCLANEPAVDSILGTQNIAYVVAEFAYVMGGAGAFILVHTLRRARPSPRVIVVHCLIALLICTVIGLAWHSAPQHSGNWPTFRDRPIYPQALAYGWLFNLYQSAVLLNNGVCCVTLATQKTPVRDPTRRLALFMIAFGSALGIVSQLLYLIRLAAPQPNQAVSTLKVVADATGPLNILSLGLGAGLLILGPAMLAIYRDRRLTRELRPLWLRLQEIQESHFKPQAVSRFHRRPSHQLERMLIEITDGLSLIQVPESKHDSSATVIARALRTNRQHVDGPATNALTVLGITSSRLDEETQLLQLAHVYSQLVAADEADPGRLSSQSSRTLDRLSR